MTNKLSDVACSVLKGVGPKLTEQLSAIGIESLEDLLFYLPLRYQDKTRITPIADVQPGQYAVVEGLISGTRVQFGRKPSLICSVSDETGDSISMRLFHYNKSQKANLTPGTRIWLFGQIRQWGKQREMIHPEYKILSEASDIVMDEHMTAIYPQIAGLSQATIRKLMEQAVLFLQSHTISEWMTPFIPESSFWTLKDALLKLHQPEPDQPVDQLNDPQHPARIRLALEELVAQRLGLRYVRRNKEAWDAEPLVGDHEVINTFMKSLPFMLTQAQQRVIKDVFEDLTQPTPMMRLVQGDVGSGKTMIAIIASLYAVTAGKQVAIMAPTEILAEQLFVNISQSLAQYNVSFLVGSLKRSERTPILTALASGEVDVLVGTHALFQDEVIYSNLGLIVIDEQHRFGVKQRLALQQKGQQGTLIPHQIVMTATPIPRSLAMTMYADLELSIIDELPPGRMPIQTIVIDNSKRDDVIERIHHICNQGQQVYWVCTLIEESDVLQCKAATDTAESLQTRLSELNIGLVHGQMKAEQKDQTMQAFKAGAIHVLVATTVIEVGVNVPNASLMVIENPERLGLSQLHQLRGRVGRGDLQSFCALLYQSPLSDVGKRRLDIMRQTTDGFKIADEDLKLRGPGDFLGTQQTGISQFRVAHIIEHQHLLPDVKNICATIEKKQPDIIPHLIKRWYQDAEDYAKV